MFAETARQEVLVVVPNPLQGLVFEPHCGCGPELTPPCFCLCLQFCQGHLRYFRYTPLSVCGRGQLSFGMHMCLGDCDPVHWTRFVRLSGLELS